MAYKRAANGVPGNKAQTSQMRGKLLLMFLWLGVAVVAAFALGATLLNRTAPQAAPDPSFAIVSPVAGSTVRAPVALRVTLDGATIGMPADGLDHLHVSVDGGQPLAAYESPDLTLPLSQGNHAVVVELAGPSHQALLPAKSVSFVVR